MLLALDHERQLALEHDVGLFLRMMAMDALTLPGSSAIRFTPKVEMPSSRRIGISRSPLATSM